MTDEKLFEKCKFWGSRALCARQRFAGLLPEVEKTRLWEKKKYPSIYVFAAMLAGFSKEQVDVALRLDRKLSETPQLHEAFVSGEVSMNKLNRVASVATPENEEEILEKSKVLSKSALETWVRDVKNENADGLGKPKNELKVVPGHNSGEELRLDNDVLAKLSELSSKGIDVNEFLREALQKREEEIKLEKARIAEELETEDNEKKAKEKKRSAYIPAKVRKIIEKEHGTKCSVPGCNKCATELHHTLPFSMSGRHDPHFLAPLCHEHHQIAHSVNLRVQEERQKWR